MPDSIDFECSGVELRLLAAGGAFWAAREVLFVADTHFGKEATFRRHAIPVPRGSTVGTLATIRRMLTGSGARQLVILGDMFHARSSLSADVRKALEGFFADHPSVRFTLVWGNHDAHVLPLPPAWPIEIVEPGQRIDNVVLTHHPAPVPKDAALLLCGHVHPAIRVGPRDDRVKLPCFWFSKRRLVLPAIGEFTGTETIRLEREDRAWILAEGQIMQVPVPRAM